MGINQTTHQKALKINLESMIYGTFAEIGAGQEVAANFFKAGGASGTVAKSISAYDMTFSDSIYGKEESGRYVCQSRVQKMVAYEYDLVLERLKEKFPERAFFAFANTVVARNFQGTNDPHGWLAFKFQESPGSAASELIVHVRMHDISSNLQQNALGILGVNMIYSSYYAKEDGACLINSLMENLSRHQIEIDMVEAHGPAFSHLDNRLLNLQLIISSCTDAVMFNEAGEVKLSKDELYRKNIQVVRGSYRPPTKVNVNILETGLKNFIEDINEKVNVVSVAEITINHLQEDGEMTQEDFLARVDLLSSLGQKVLITNMPQYFNLTDYLYTFKPNKLSVVLGVYNFMQIFDDEYNKLQGGPLEALGSLLKPNSYIYLYPYREETENDTLINLSNVEVSKENKGLLDYIKTSCKVRDLRGYDDSLLHIYSRKVLRMIKANEAGWEDYVPAKVAQIINEKCLFGHPCEHVMKP